MMTDHPEGHPATACEALSMPELRSIQGGGRIRIPVGVADDGSTIWGWSDEP